MGCVQNTRWEIVYRSDLLPANASTPRHRSLRLSGCGDYIVMSARLSSQNPAEKARRQAVATAARRAERRMIAVIAAATPASRSKINSWDNSPPGRSSGFSSAQRGFARTFTCLQVDSTFWRSARCACRTGKAVSSGACGPSAHRSEHPEADIHPTSHEPARASQASPCDHGRKRARCQRIGAVSGYRHKDEDE